MSEQTDPNNLRRMSDYGRPANYERPNSSRTEATPFSNGDALEFRKSSPHVGPATLKSAELQSPVEVETPTELTAEQMVDRIAHCGTYLALVRRDLIDRNWNLEEDGLNGASSYLDNAA